MSTKLPEHFTTSSDGDLLRYRSGSPGVAEIVRRNYRKTHAEIDSVADLKATLRNGQWAWPGGYRLTFWTRDGAAMSFQTVRRNLVAVIDAIRRDDSYSGWLVVACDVNWEDDDLVDAHTNEKISPEYELGD